MNNRTVPRTKKSTFSRSQRLQEQRPGPERLGEGVSEQQTWLGQRPASRGPAATAASEPRPAAGHHGAQRRQRERRQPLALAPCLSSTTGETRAFNFYIFYLPGRIFIIIISSDRRKSSFLYSTLWKGVKIDIPQPHFVINFSSKSFIRILITSWFIKIKSNTLMFFNAPI